jgi:purine-binding chemotaxis protein CheW
MSRFVAFKVGDAMYALPIDQVQQIVRHEGVTEVPQSPRYVEGVMNLRGEVVPVVNLRARFGLHEDDTARRSRVIIATVGGKNYGLHVDDVREIVDVEDDAVETENIDVLNVSAEVVRAIARTSSELFIVLNMERILASSDPVLIGR